MFGAFIVGLAAAGMGLAAVQLLRRLAEHWEEPLPLPDRDDYGLGVCEWCGGQPAVAFRVCDAGDIWLCPDCLAEAEELARPTLQPRINGSTD